MEEPKFTSFKKVDVRGIDAEDLKGMFPPLELPEWMASKSGRESFRKGKRAVYGRWGVLYEALSEREALEGLKFVDEWDLSEVKRQVDDLTLEVESVKAGLKECKEGIGRIIDKLDELREKPVTRQTELLEIDDTLEVIRPIPVVIEEYEDEVVAAFPEIEAFGAALCEAEAIMSLKDKIKETFFELEEASNDELGKIPQSWKRVLSKVVKRIGNSE